MPTISVEVFDPDPAVVERVTRDHAATLEALRHEHDEAHLQAARAEILADGQYAYVEPSLIGYYRPPADYLTIDIVAQRDAARRMPFRARPTGSHEDPAGLLAAQRAYEAKLFELLQRGEKLQDRPGAWFHCIGDPTHPELRALAEPLARAADHVDELIEILRDDGDGYHRALAAFLIAYTPDGKRVVDALLPALRDPSPHVRNNASRVLAVMAEHHPEIDIPIDPFLDMLAYPDTTDRNKAAAALKALLSRPGAAPHFAHVAHQAGPILLAMLKLAQPNNHDYAYDILTLISGEHHGDRDIAAWQAWLAR